MERADRVTVKNWTLWIINNITTVKEGGIGIFGFAVLGSFSEIDVWVFVPKDFGFVGFSVLCGSRIFRFLASGFHKKY